MFNDFFRFQSHCLVMSKEPFQVVNLNEFNKSLQAREGLETPSITAIKMSVVVCLLYFNFENQSSNPAGDLQTHYNFIRLRSSSKHLINEFMTKSITRTESRVDKVRVSLTSSALEYWSTSASEICAEHKK